ncbi:MAG TPA: 6-bladed beta-propeller [Methanoregulaceae archaeon]|nr:6-bladed beta-propeller [Methanoregulaceae archaeon]
MTKLFLGLVLCVVLIAGGEAAVPVGYQFNGTWGGLGSEPGNFSSPLGIASDQAGNVYVVDSNNHRIQKFSSSGTFLTEWGSLGEWNGFLQYPAGITVDRDGTVLVTDAGNNRVQVFTDEGMFINAWGSDGVGDGEFWYAEGIACDSEGNVYVVDHGNHRVQKFDPTGVFLAKWGKNGGDGSSGTGPGEFYHPRGILVDQSDRVYVVDTENNRVQKFDLNGSYLGEWGSFGSGDGKFTAPRGIAADGGGNVMVVEELNHRVQKFTPDGIFISSWGIEGSLAGQFSHPCGIAVGSNGEISITDSNNHRIQCFRPVISFVNKMGASGTGPGEFILPTGVAYDAFGDLYITDMGNHRIQKYAADGTWLCSWGTQGAEEGQFHWPWGIAINGTGYVYVGDSMNNRVQVFSGNGTFVTSWGYYGTGAGEFNAPCDIALDPADRVYVADYGNQRIQVFEADGTYLFTAWGEGYLNPRGITIDRNGNIVCADDALRRIYTLSPTGAYIRYWGSNGTGPGEFYFPSGVVTDGNGDFYITDTMNHRVQKLNETGGFIASWGSFGSADGQCNQPYGIALSPGGALAITDSENARILHYTTTGARSPVLGSIDPDTGFLGLPVTIVSLSGSYFQEGPPAPQVNLKRAGQSLVRGSEVSVLSPERIACRFDLPADPAAEGIWDVVLTNPDGQSVTLGSAFRIESLHVLGIDPPSGVIGTPGIGYSVTGTGFHPGSSDTEVALNRSGYPDIPATNVTVQSSRNITCNFGFPSDEAVLGIWNVVVTGPGGQSASLPDGFSLVLPPPCITDIHPSTGVNNASVRVTLLGSGFRPGMNETAVRLNQTGHPDIIGTSVSVLSSGELSCQFGIPADGAGSGIWDVVVTNPDHQAGSLQEGFITAQPDNSFVLEWGSDGVGPGQFWHPYDITVDKQRSKVYVVDYNLNRVQKFTTDGRYLGGWGSWGNGTSQFMCPTGIAVDSTGNIFVGDSWNYRVQKFNSTFGYLTHWGSPGNDEGEFDTPWGVAVDSDDNVYISDFDGVYIQKFNGNGEFILRFGGAGSGPGQLVNSWAVAVDRNDDVLVADTVNHRVQKFSKNGDFLTMWGSAGTGNGQFDFSRGIATDGLGNVYVVDGGNNRVQRFSGDGVYLSQWGSYGNGSGQFDYPYGIATDSAGFVYVVDNFNHRVQLFAPGAITPGIRSIDPNSSIPGSPVNLTIQGANFYTGEMKPTVILHRTGHPDIIATEVNAVSSDLITCKCILPTGGDAIGDWNVTITNPDGKSITLVDGFSIVPPTSITLTTPVGGENWTRGTDVTLSWIYRDDPGPQVRIELLKGASLSQVILENAPIGFAGSGFAVWTIPFDQDPGADYRVRITSVSTPAYTDTSRAAFRISAGAPITVTAPNGNESWKPGTSQRIWWKYTGNPGPAVKIEALRGETVLGIVTPSTPLGENGFGSFPLTVPMNAPYGTDYRIRVTDTNDSTCTDTSDGPFKVISGTGASITLVSPNGGDDWQQGSTRTISWNYIGDPGPTVKIEALRGDTVLAVIAPGAPVGIGGSGSLNLTLPINAPLGTDYRIRISSTSNSVYTDMSDAPFSISGNTSSSIMVISPDGGENYLQGSTQAIRWTYTGNPGPTLRIEALRAEKLLAVIMSSYPIGAGGSGSFNLTFPYNTPLGSDYTIRVTSTSNPAWTDTSDDSFTVSPAITVATPNGGETYQVGDILSMNWTYTGNPGPTVDIAVMKGPATLKTLAGISIGAGGSGSYQVTIPSSTPSGSDYKIQVTSTSYPACSDRSDEAFTIIAG